MLWGLTVIRSFLMVVSLCSHKTNAIQKNTETVFIFKFIVLVGNLPLMCMAFITMESISVVLL